MDNKHITDYLDYYIGLTTSSEFAVLLRGKWGSGKSWFIKNYMEKNQTQKYLYVSLYGLTSYRDIEDAFFAQLHPYLSSKGAKIAGSIFKGIIKATIKVDWDKGKESLDIKSEIPSINLNDYFKNVDDRIIIFDDLERCSIPIINLFGYINQLVESNGLKVVLVANEEEIIRINELESEEAKKYLLIKEKVIGKSFETKIDFESAIKSFSDQLINIEFKSFLDKKVELIKKIFYVGGYNNLRHLRQAIFDFERFYSFLSLKAKNKNDLIDHITQVFFALSFEIKKGKIKEEEIEMLLGPLYHEKKDEPKTLMQLIKAKYSILDMVNTPISSDLWEHFFKYGDLDTNKLDITIENSIYFIDENKDDWVKLWHQFDLEDDELIEIVEKEFNKLKNCEYNDTQIILHITGILLNFNRHNLINITRDNILNTAKGNISFLKNQGKLIFIRKEDDFPSHFSLGLSYQMNDSEEFIELANYIIAQSNELHYDNLPQSGNHLMNILKESVTKFIGLIVYDKPSKMEYYDIPVLKFIDPEKFIEVFLSLPNKSKKELSWNLSRRYSSNFFNFELIEELEWLKQVKNIAIIESEKLEGKASGVIIETLFIRALDASINSLSPVITS